VTGVSVWAPDAGSVSAVVGGADFPMTEREGWWSADVPAGDYAFRLDGGDPLPDPRSLWQPSGVFGPSRPYDHAEFSWTDRGWRGVPLQGSVIYELHIGTFTPEGTFDAAIERLDHLTELGVSVVEVMPVAAFQGEWGWGYDGVCLWAVHDPYGGPDGLKRFVSACHQRGLAVLLDVVYNHVGPGNTLGAFGPYFTAAHTTPWGPAVNLDQPGSDEVRAFLIGNALMWLRDYHIDGLRLDAVHALADSRALPLLESLAIAVDGLSAATGRALSLIAESDLNDARLVTSRQAGGSGLSGQWDDDFHHAVHVAVTGETTGYYADFDSMAALAKVLSRVFFHDGTWSSFRGRTHGRPVDRLLMPAYRFVVYDQDHDQIGNRAVGDRLSISQLRVAAGLVLTSPYTPMLFMGEEWGASTPWQFFSSFTDPGLAAAVSTGRRSEFERYGWASSDVPDPQDPATFQRSKLSWSELSPPEHASLLSWYRTLLALRRSEPALTDPQLTSVSVSFDEAARWVLVHRGPLRVVAHVGSSATLVPLDAPGDSALGAAVPSAPRAAGAAGAAGVTVLAASDPGVGVSGAATSMPPMSFAVLRVCADLVE
jgi:maltooligosyltrehalose trehalohydrolase